jgi:flagellar hook-length control protein FliK
MTIQLVSASPGNPLAAASANGTAEADSSSDFGDLFNRIMGKFSSAENAAEHVASMPETPASLAALLPEELRALLRKNKAHGAEDEAREAPVFSFLGSLNLPMNQLPHMPLEDQASLPELSLGLAQGQGAKLSLPGEGKLMPTGTAKFAVTLAMPDAAPTENLAEQPAVPVNETLAGAQAVTHSIGTHRPAEAGEQRIQTPVNSPAWSQDFGDKIIWMAKNGEQRVELRLTPANLGPLQIQLHLDADKTSANLIATVASPEVRQAIEDALPRLREMLASAGVALGDTQVGTQAQRQQASENQSNGRGSSLREDENAAILDHSAEASAITHLTRGDGRVDLFA